MSGSFRAPDLDVFNLFGWYEDGLLFGSLAPGAAVHIVDFLEKQIALRRIGRRERMASVDATHCGSIGQRDHDEMVAPQPSERIVPGGRRDVDRIDPEPLQQPSKNVVLSKCSQDEADHSRDHDYQRQPCRDLGPAGLFKSENVFDERRRETVVQNGEGDVGDDAFGERPEPPRQELRADERDDHAGHDEPQNKVDRLDAFEVRHRSTFRADRSPPVSGSTISQPSIYADSRLSGTRLGLWSEISTTRLDRQPEAKARPDPTSPCLSRRTISRSQTSCARTIEVCRPL